MNLYGSLIGGMGGAAGYICPNRVGNNVLEMRLNGGYHQNTDLIAVSGVFNGRYF